jgi:hypothetical protein
MITVRGDKLVLIDERIITFPSISSQRVGERRQSKKHYNYRCCEVGPVWVDCVVWQRQDSAAMGRSAKRHFKGNNKSNDKKRRRENEQEWQKTRQDNRDDFVTKPENEKS